MSPLLTPRDVAELLRIPTASVYRLGREGTLRAVRIGRTMRFSPAVVEAFIASGGAPHAGGTEAERP